MKKIHRFHIDLRNQHLAELMKTGETVCNSAFIRQLVYKKLQEDKVSFKTEIIEYGKCLYRKGIQKYNPKLAMYNLLRGNYNKDLLLIDYEKYFYTGISVQEIEMLFDPKLDKKAKYEIIKKASDYAKNPKLMRSKVWLFQDPLKTIKKISLVR